MATQENSLALKAYRDWVDVLDRISQAGPEGKFGPLMPEARKAYERCKELDGEKVAPRQRITPPRSSRPDDEEVDREYARGKDRP